MNFTYQSYITLLQKLKDNKYLFTNYHEFCSHQKCVILRHDVDMSLESAVKFAEIEHDMGVTSTYFVLLRTDLYNVASKRSREWISQIQMLGHEIGLHFDEAALGENDEVVTSVISEAKTLSDILDRNISTVSMHRPSKHTLEANYEIPGIINSYSKVFFNDFKYLSDSRKMWREPILDIVDSQEYKRLHILTHAFWYKDNEESINDTVRNFIFHANKERYYQVADNIRDIKSIMDVGELACR